MARFLTEVKRGSAEVILAGLTDKNSATSTQAGLALIREAKSFDLGLRQYLELAIQPGASDHQRFVGLTGYEAALVSLNLPFKNDFDQGVLLQAASDSFQTYPGTRAMFPEVIDSMLRWKNRQDRIETVDKMVAQSRTINGNEMISTAVEDDSKDRDTATIAEFGRIPVRTIRTSQTSVGIFKHGSGIRTSYEFERRASLDILTPYALRVARELEISKVKAATSILVNGDGVNAAAPVVAFSLYGGVAVNGTSSVLSTQYKAFAKWMVAMAKAGTPVDTICGNLDVYLELLFMFTPTLAGQRSQIEAIAAQGGPSVNLNLPILGGNADFVLSSSMAANKIMGYSRGDTLEELKENGSSISENERSIQNQSVIYVRSENTGYKLAFGDTRSILDLAA